MNYDNDRDDHDQSNRKDVALKVERFRQQSQVYLNRLPILKRQLNETNRLQQFDLYVQKLNDIGKVVQDLSQNVRNLEQLHLRLSEKDRVKLEDQIRSLRTDVDREASEFQLLRERAMVSSFDQHTTLPDDASASNPTAELDTGESELRQRQVATSRLNDSYDLLEQDLIMLRETIGEVAQLVAQQNQQISHTDHLIHTAQDRIRNASTLLQKAVHSRYLTLASGALLGATLGGPIGCVMGMKIGALVALSGSAVGALSANLWQNRAARTDQSHDESSAYNQAML